MAQKVWRDIIQDYLENLYQSKPWWKQPVIWAQGGQISMMK